MKEQQQNVNSEIFKTKRITFGVRTEHTYLEDPKHLLFNLSRYKFVSKMFSGYEKVLEIGCGDGFGTTLVASVVRHLTATDLDPRFIHELELNHPYADRIKFETIDFIENHFDGKFDAAFCLDVLEHIPREHEDAFMKNIVKSLKRNGDCIIGLPSLESQ